MHLTGGTCEIGAETVRAQEFEGRRICTYMLDIVRDFRVEFHKNTVGSRCHKPSNTDLPQLIEQAQQTIQ